MRQHIPLISFGMIATGVLFLTAAAAQEGMSTSGFAVYSSNQPQLPVRFEYPADWQVEDSRGTTEAYTQVQIYGPASLEGRLRTYMVVRAVPPKAQGGLYAGLDEMVGAYQKTILPTLRIEQERQTVVLGSPARVLDINGTLLLPWKARDPQPVPVKSQRVFMEKNGLFYELSWMATPETSEAVERFFSHLLNTLVLND